jgi:hypothetical protein
MFVLAVLPIGFALFLFVASPHGMGPDLNPLGVWTTWLGIAMATVGFVWMIRIYRATLDPEAHRSVWRSHRR